MVELYVINPQLAKCDLLPQATAVVNLFFCCCSTYQFRRIASPHHQQLSLHWFSAPETHVFFGEGVVIRFGMCSWRCHGYGLNTLRDILILFLSCSEWLRISVLVFLDVLPTSQSLKMFLVDKKKEVQLTVHVHRNATDGNN